MRSDDDHDDDDDGLLMSVLRAFCIDKIDNGIVLLVGEWVLLRKKYLSTCQIETKKYQTMHQIEVKGNQKSEKGEGGGVKSLGVKIRVVGEG